MLKCHRPNTHVYTNEQEKKKKLTKLKRFSEGGKMFKKTNKADARRTRMSSFRPDWVNLDRIFILFFKYLNAMTGERERESERGINDIIYATVDYTSVITAAAYSKKKTTVLLYYCFIDKIVRTERQKKKKNNYTISFPIFFQNKKIFYAPVLRACVCGPVVVEFIP